MGAAQSGEIYIQYILSKSNLTDTSSDNRKAAYVKSKLAKLGLYFDKINNKQVIAAIDNLQETFTEMNKHLWELKKTITASKEQTDLRRLANNVETIKTSFNMLRDLIAELKPDLKIIESQIVKTKNGTRYMDEKLGIEIQSIRDEEGEEEAKEKEKEKEKEKAQTNKVNAKTKKVKKEAEVLIKVKSNSSAKRRN